MGTMNSSDEEITSGATSRFSCAYRPGAINAHSWYSTHGSAMRKAASSVTFIGTMKGVITPVAIIRASHGSATIIGRAMKS